ncbi:MAG: PAS domain S-box protein [Bacteroidia bacterium]|nr:PAS domain S-box protein [Bacteroidia bacterium]
MQTGPVVQLRPSLHHKVNLKPSFLLLLMMGLTISLSIDAQRFNTVNYTVQEDLPGNHLNKIYQDRLGRLWIGTMSGGCRFDGKTFTRFEQGNVLYSNPVKTIYEDRNGNIWFGTIRKGLVKLTGASYSTYTANDGLLSDNVNALCEDQKGNLWVGTSEGISRFDGKTFYNITQAKGLVNNNVFDLFADSKGRIWVATIGGVSFYDGQNFTNFTVEQGLLNNIVYCIREDKDGRIWMGTYEGVSVWDGKRFINYTRDNGLPNERVETVMMDHSGNWWVGTYGGGIAKFINGRFEAVEMSEGINSNIVKSLVEDREGNYWLGTLNGLYKYNGDRFVSYTLKDGLSNNNILSVFPDSGGGIWFGTLAGGVNYFKDNRFLNISTADGLKSNTIWSISGDRSGYIWFGTTNGPARYNPLSKKIELAYPELQSLIIYAFLQDRNGNNYFGTDKGIFKYMADGTSLRIGINEGLANDKVRVLYEDLQGVVWVGTLKGLFSLDNNRAISFDEANRLPKAPITSIINDRYGNLVISTYEFGVIRYNPGKQANPITILNRKSGLNSEKILFNFIDSREMLWLGTSEGIDNINWKQFIEEGKIRSVHYDKSNGYLGIESNAACEDKFGNIWFGTVNGAIRYNPSAGELPVTLPLVSIGNVQLFLENTNWKKKKFKVNPYSGLPEDLVLPHNSNHLSFVCQGIYLTAPDEVRYRYILEGFEDNWSPPSKTSTVSYSNIPPGSYIFKVQASVNGKDWSVPVTYSFTILPPVWKTPFFYLLYVVVGAGSVLLAYRVRTRSLRKSQELLKRKVESRTRELQAKNLELAKLSLVASETDNAVMIFDEHQELEWVNTGYTKMTGFTLEETRQSKGGTLKDLTTNLDVLDHLEDCIRLRRSFIYESKIQHKNGQHRWASSTLTPILNDKSQLKNIVVIDTDITLRKHMEEQIREALEEKGLLLREIHHRVKNNLQIIISLFNLQTSYVTDTNAYKALKEGQDRIKSMALIHERFYQSDGLSKIDFDDYIKRLAENLMQSFRVNADQVALIIHAEKISLDIDTAVPCGLIINEIVSNSLKHAFKEGRKGEILVELNQTMPDRFRLVIGDNGIGMPEGFTLENSDSLGIQLIQALTDQLEGEMKIETAPGKGVKYIINFKRIS